MTTEEDKIDKLKRWAADFPGAEDHLPALLRMRNGPLKDFVDNHLVPKIRSEDWFTNMRKHFELEDSQKREDSEKERLAEEEEELEDLKVTLEKLKVEENILEKEVAQDLPESPKPEENDKLDPNRGKIGTIRKEEQLLSLTTLIAQTEYLQNEIFHAKSSQSSRDLVIASIPDILDRVKHNFSQSLYMSALGSGSRRKGQELRVSASGDLKDLLNLEEIHVPSLLKDWWRRDIEKDIGIFLNEIEKMKANEKISAIEKLVEDWTLIHVSLASQNSNLQSAVTDAKRRCERLRQTAPPELNQILELLIREKKSGFNFRHFHKISTDAHSVLTENQLDARSKRELEGPNEFNFDLTCSLFKTWPNSKLAFWNTAQEGKAEIGKWAEECERLKEEIYSLLPSNQKLYDTNPHVSMK